MAESGSPGPVLAVDIGGTKMAAGVAEPGGRLITWTQVPTVRDADAERLWCNLEDVLVQVLDAAKVGDPAELSGIGCGCGGPMQWPAGLVSPLNIPAWRDFPLKERLAARFGGGGGPVRVHNDAVCMAAGEHWRGAGRSWRNVLGMVVSTGVGGGLILNDRLIDGASGNAGHIGHVVVYPDGPACVCGGRGCLEAIARGPALAAIGGGLSQAGPLLFEPLQEALAVHARLDFTRKVRVVPAALGQNAGLVGAAALISAGDRYWTGGS